MDYKEKLGRAQKLYADAKAILTNDKATAEEKASVKALIAEAEELKAEAIQLKDILASADEMIPHLEEKQGDDKEKPVRKDPTEFKDWAGFLEAAHRANHKNASFRRVDPRLQWFDEDVKGGHQKKDMVEAVGASGGFLVPAEFLPQLQAVLIGCS